MSSSKSILVVGSSGFVGSSIARALRNDHKVFGAYHSNPTLIRGQTPVPLDVRDSKGLKRVLSLIQPDVIVYAAGTNDPASFDADKKHQESVHSTGVSNLLSASQHLHCQWIFLSNDYVFDGNRGRYRDSEKPIADREIGKSKVTAESYVRSRTRNFFVLRSGPLYGVGPVRAPSFLDLARVALARGKLVSLKDDETHAFVSIDMLIEVVRSAIEQETYGKTVHLGSDDVMSWYEWGKRAARTLGLDPSKVLKAPADPSGKPRNYALVTSNDVQSLEVKAPVMEEALDLIQKHLILRI